MPKRLHLICIFFLSIQLKSKAQFINYIGYEGEKTDSSFLFWDTVQLTDMIVDSSGLWQIGGTAKPFFTLGGTFGPAIMTDSVNSYPASADAWFILPLALTSGDILSFTHKYETTAGSDGCVVELSLDQGNSWSNVKGDCNGDTIGYFSILTDHFYGFYDTLSNGLQAFNGTSNGWMTSRIQLFDCCPIKPGKSSAFCNMNNVLVKFRFNSDTVAENLDGWIIDSVKVNNNYYPSSVNHIQKKNTGPLQVVPNPSYDGVLNFPSLDDQPKFTIEIYSNVGQLISIGPYSMQA